MGTYAFINYSVGLHSEAQQLDFIKSYLDSKKLKIDDIYADNISSADVVYKKYNLKDLCDNLTPGDIIVVSHVSHIIKSGISELSSIVNKYFGIKRLRFIICDVGLDIDCSDINPMTEMQLSMLATFARIEKCLIKERTKSSLKTRKKMLAENGAFVSKSGNVTTHLGRPKGCECPENAIKASCKARRDKAKENPNNQRFIQFLCHWEGKNGTIYRNTDLTDFVSELNALGYKTARGLEFNESRAWGTIRIVRKIYATEENFDSIEKKEDAKLFKLISRC